MKIITSIFDKYPNLFHGKTPVFYTDIPEGWVKFLEGFCDLVVTVSSDVQISEFSFERISSSNGFLDVQYSLSPSLPNDDAFVIGARAFAVRNRTCAGCVCCGAIIKTFPEKGEWPFCARHLRRKIAADKSCRGDGLYVASLPQLESIHGADALASLIE